MTFEEFNKQNGINFKIRMIECQISMHHALYSMLHENTYDPLVKACQLAELEHELEQAKKEQL